MSGIFFVLLILAAGTWLAAALGAGVVILIKNESASVTDLILGFAAGVILMVSFVELIHPAIHMASGYSQLPAWVVVPGGFGLGFLTTFALDIYITRIKTRRGNGGVYKQGLMLFGALSVHNIPEGLALGVLIGAAGGRFNTTAALAIAPLVIAVALHKFPEGAAISVAFQKGGMGKLKSFAVGQASGFFGFLAGIIGFVTAISVNAILPYAMAFAGGAMVWVAIHELIPESKCEKNKRPYLATIGIMLGILLMLFVDTTLHDHSQQGHCCVRVHDVRLTNKQMFAFQSRVC